jgi:hypothetical protein
MTTASDRNDYSQSTNKVLNVEIEKREDGAVCYTPTIRGFDSKESAHIFNLPS